MNKVEDTKRILVWLKIKGSYIDSYEYEDEHGFIQRLDSLDWQKKNLWPKFSSLLISIENGLTRNVVLAAMGFGVGGYKGELTEIEDAVLKAVMELIGKED